MDFIKLVHEEAREWASKLTPKEIADILTEYYDLNVKKRPFLSHNINHTLAPPQLPPVLIPVCAKTIGIQAEQEVFDILSSKYMVNNTANAGKCGDFFMPNESIMIEVKKYAKTVPLMEVQKFYRDINTNSSIKAAVFISLTSKISGFNNALRFERKSIAGNEVPIVFLSLKDSVLQKESIFAAIDILVSDLAKQSKYIQADNTQFIAEQIDSNLNLLSQSRTVIDETQTMMNKQLNILHKKILESEINIKSCIKQLQVHELDLEKTSTEELLADLDMSQSSKNLLYELLGDRIVFYKEPVIKVTEATSIKLLKTMIKVNIHMRVTEPLLIDGPWSYNGKVLTIRLSENTLEIIKKLLV